MSQISPERQAAFSVLRRTFERDEFTEVVFREVAEEKGLTGRSRAQAQRLAFGSVQRRGSSDALIAGFMKKGGRKPLPPVMAALRLGMYELLFADATPDHAAVDQAVSLCRAAGADHAAGFVNALLRRTLRERDAVMERLADDSTKKKAAVAHSAPDWLVDLWWDELGPDRARSLLASINLPAERAVRVNTRRVTREEMIERLADDELQLTEAEGAWPLAPPELLIARGSTANVEVAAREGLVVSQSRGSAAVVEVLDPQPNERILDLCAGPGIKTGQIAARLSPLGNMVSVEPDEARAGEISDQLERLGVHNGLVIEADARVAVLKGEFDRVLVDAPCSDLGALASRPDARWRKSPAVIDRVLELQGPILEAAAQSLVPGGTLVYSTCTISKRENSELVAAVADRAGLEVDDLGAINPDIADPHDSRFIQLMPDRDRTTGFFISRLRKPSA